MKEKEFVKIERAEDGVTVITTNINIDSIVSDMNMNSIVSRLLGNGDKKIYNPKPTKYIDLGLPSGTLWASENEEGYYNYDEAVENFGDNLPTKKQLEELIKECTWKWNKNSYTVIGKNGNSIFMPAAGYNRDGIMYNVNSWGYYWSSTSYSSGYVGVLYFYSDKVYMNYDHCHDKQSVRLIKQKLIKK